MSFIAYCLLLIAHHSLLIAHYFNGGTSLTSFLPQWTSQSKRRRSLELFFFWSTQWPHNPIVLAMMKNPFNPSISNPRSLNTAPIIPSTFRDLGFDIEGLN